MKRDVLDQTVNVQCHDFFLLKSYKLFRQNGLFLVRVLGLGGTKAKILCLYLPTRLVYLTWNKWPNILCQPSLATHQAEVLNN